MDTSIRRKLMVMVGGCLADTMYFNSVYYESPPDSFPSALEAPAAYIVRNTESLEDFTDSEKRSVFGFDVIAVERIGIGQNGRRRCDRTSVDGVAGCGRFQRVVRNGQGRIGRSDADGVGGFGAFGSGDAAVRCCPDEMPCIFFVHGANVKRGNRNGRRWNTCKDGDQIRGRMGYRVCGR